MNIFVRISNAWRNLFRRRRLSLQNSTDNRVEWYIHISPANIFLALISFVLLVFIGVLTLISYSPVLDMLPGFRTNVENSHEIMVQNILRIDSMEHVINDMMLYNDNIALIMDGKSPVVRSSMVGDSVSTNRTIVSPNAIDSALRSQMEGEGEYNLQRAALNRSAMVFVVPTEGEISQHFDIGADRRSIKIEASGTE